jgi:rare lipoprotein A
VSGKHKPARARHRAVRVNGRHRKPGSGMSVVSEKTGMLAITGAVAAGTTLGSTLTLPDGHHGSSREATANLAGIDDPLQLRVTDRADRGSGRPGLGTGTPSPTATRHISGSAVTATPTAPTSRPTTAPAVRPTARPTTPRAKPAGSPSPTPRPTATQAAQTTTCKASFYDEGQTTASGEPFDPDALTAAHRSLAFGTRLRVTNLATGESVTVRINDRGPFVADRCLDLSRAAFDAIAPLDAGVATVRYQVL